MASVIGTPYARAPRNIKMKNPMIGSFKTRPHAGEPGIPTLSSVSEVIACLDTVLDQIQSSAAENKDLQTLILNLCSNLKAYGSQLELSHKDQLDRAFVHIRNAGRQEKIDFISRIHLLEVVELRAGRWSTQEQVSNYYQSKLAEIEELSFQDGKSFSQTAPPQGTSVNSSQLTSSSTSPPETPPPLLSSGEVIKFSGKYSQVSKVPGKNFIKDEVVIRNADSGKVNPGAKERLVQITGAGEDNIEKAKQLMEQTIMRNASPVRSESTSESGGNENAATDNEVFNSSGGFRQSIIDPPALNEFHFTVNVGPHAIRLVGLDYESVQRAKLILDEHLGPKPESDRKFSLSSSYDDNVKTETVSSLAVISPQECVKAKEPVKKYSRQNLLHWSVSPLCKKPPPNFSKVEEEQPEIVRKVCEPFNSADYLNKFPEQFIQEQEIITNSNDD